MLETTRMGPVLEREDERNGAGSERIWTEVGRRSCWDGAELWGLEVEAVDPEKFAAVDGGRAGVVTERLTTMPRGRGAGAGANDE